MPRTSDSVRKRLASLKKASSFHDFHSHPSHLSGSRLAATTGPLVGTQSATMNTTTQW